ncbi:aldo/keto reductase [Aquimarina sp. RZ0]|uniref:aldo/keto reductase n=1 Tax=Aquimarina sp. RZ0 TaxID=2607730 RepID=UPI0011F1DA3F|nr:aldo/keto reductase [Aquimarina sp. RZ0]KAA1246207.1 aldo/keto reductase [Aquimarina sp. RZ0]
MNYRQLGVSDLRISELSFGCMSLEKDLLISKDIIYTAIDNGINYFDTADIYQNGENEEMLGKLIRDFRKDIVIATKVGNEYRKDGTGWDWNPKKSYIISAIEKSLKRLQTDYIDLYQLHGGTIDDTIDETIDAFESLQKQGKIRYYGISSIRPNVIREYIKRSNIISVMIQYSLLDRRAEESCLDLLYDNNIGVLTRGTLAKGLLAGKPAADYLDYTITEVSETIKILKKVSGKQRSLSQTAVSFVLKNRATTSVVVGASRKKQLIECLGISTVPPLSDTELKLLKESNKVYKYLKHR